MDKFLSLLIWLLLLLGINLVKISRNRKRLQSGEDKAHVKKAAEPLLEALGTNKVLYAHWEEHEHFGRGTKTTFYRYALTYQDRSLYLLPLQINKRTREIQPGKPIQLKAESLGRIAVTTKEKNGAVSRVELHLYDKEAKTVLQLTVDGTCLRKSRWYPLNILQQEECEAFYQFILPLAQQVEAENPGMDAIMEAHAREGFGVIGLILAALGAFFVLFVFPVGILFALIGLILAVIGKIKGGKSNKGLIISLLCFAWTLGFSWFYINYLFV